MRLKVFICLALALITFGLYWPTRHFAFLYYDDQLFLLNPFVATGLSLSGLLWATTAVVAGNWHPITLSSFLLMHQFFGMDPGAEHLLNAAIHSANAVLLFLVLWEMTGAMWRSAIVAAIFAWHPLRVESVAWISERKDVLFLFFLLLSLWSYTRYTRAGSSAPTDSPNERTIFEIPPRTSFYSGSLLFFILGFLSKPMVVTLPFLLLLLDYWPLQRLNWRTLRGLLAEKVPFFGLTVIFSALTFWLQRMQGAVKPLSEVAMTTRIENAVSSYWQYLGKLFWPTKLAAIYPYPERFEHIQILLISLVLIGISALCILQFSRRPYLAVGWFWYLGTMVPVIGLVQVGMQALADRYTYLPLIGPIISLVWLVSEWAQSKPLLKIPVTYATATCLAACALLTERQLPYWRNTIALFERTISITAENSLAQYPLAMGFEHAGDSREASVHYRLAVAMHPDDEHFMANFYLAELMAKSGHYRDAVNRLEAALKILPDSAEAMNNLAWILSTCPDERVRNGKRAVQLAEQACEFTHDQSPAFLTTLSAAYAEVGRFGQAIATVQKAGALAQNEGNRQLFTGDAQLLQQFLNHETYTDEASPAGD